MARASQQWLAQKNDCPPGKPGVQNPAYRSVLLFMKNAADAAFFAAGPPEAKRLPFGSSKPKAQRGGLSGCLR